jgi:serine/threonine-protein kinase
MKERIVWEQSHWGLLGGELDRSISKWNAGKELYEVAMRAVKIDSNRKMLNSERIFLSLGISHKKS